MIDEKVWMTNSERLKNEIETWQVDGVQCGCHGDGTEGL